MSDQTLEKYIQQYIHFQPGREVHFAWQGGEPTLLGRTFSAELVELQKKHTVPGKQIHNALQTNGTLLDDDWCRILSRQSKFLVGLSIDGPAANCTTNTASPAAASQRSTKCGRASTCSSGTASASTPSPSCTKISLIARSRCTSFCVRIAAA